MTLLIVGGALYALLILFMAGAMMVSGRTSEREEQLAYAVSHPADQADVQPGFLNHRDAA
ncbi:hypothetical protein [Larsenimonas suaedae]|uniref:Cbb3-type cytochrome oxidase assembly protein CcoS n=1 Tax=Larsenimonas suaedae TaxID=1851019 RepID=A0ABU1GR11_9GAMM|nr:hypothetical protein [Larsenimonas suaedae]MCM2972733.1 hypothetical protein [Larsenimonas suaedae]MDR5894470.1 hypothetical protein [Larsenimonas suaedae]